MWEAKLRQRINNDILTRIAKAQEIARVDHTWDDKFMKKWYVYVVTCQCTFVWWTRNKIFQHARNRRQLLILDSKGLFRYKITGHQ